MGSRTSLASLGSAIPRRRLSTASGTAVWLLSRTPFRSTANRKCHVLRSRKPRPCMMRCCSSTSIARTMSMPGTVVIHNSLIRALADAIGTAQEQHNQLCQQADARHLERFLKYAPRQATSGGAPDHQKFTGQGARRQVWKRQGQGRGPERARASRPRQTVRLPERAMLRGRGTTVVSSTRSAPPRSCRIPSPTRTRLMTGAPQAALQDSSRAISATGPELVAVFQCEQKHCAPLLDAGKRHHGSSCKDARTSFAAPAPQTLDDAEGMMSGTKSCARRKRSQSRVSSSPSASSGGHVLVTRLRVRRSHEA